MEDKKQDISSELCGSVEEVIYKNSQNGYIVLIINSKEEGLVSVTGNLGDIAQGETLVLRGGWVLNPRYGRQFSAVVCERSKPTTPEQIRAYLGSGIIKGLGPALSKRIVDIFGDEAIDIIDNDHMRLTEVKGINAEKAIYIAEEYHKITGINEVIGFMNEYNLSPAYAVEVWKRFEHESVKALKLNPYILCEGNSGADFFKVDRIAFDLGFDVESTPRIRAGILYVLRENSYSGHTCLPAEKLKDTVCQRLGIEESTFNSILKQCLEDRLTESLTLGGKTFIYLPEYFTAELYVAEKLAYMIRTSANYCADYSKEIDGVEFTENIKYEKLQRVAINSCLCNKVFILTGGPGTGKTTTLNGVIKILKQFRQRILLCAPTGRAAKRMTDLTGMEARTIHRLLEVEHDDKTDELKFKRNEKNPLSANVVIVDEMSMVDIQLMASLLRALKPECKLIMVGDSNQLPSVGAGNVLRDLIKSGHIPTVELTEIFRQAAKSLIVTNAHKIVSGEMPVLNDKTNDFFFMPKVDEEDMARLVSDLCERRLPKSYGFSPIDDIQVLSPTKLGAAGTKELNKRLQSALNPPSPDKAEMKYFDVTFRVGDKVMQVKNDYDVAWTRLGERGSGIFNGDIGIIKKVDRFSSNLEIDFEGRYAIFTPEMLKNLEHAYAVTIHKSQGSEYDAVIIPVSAVTKNLLYRNLLYTGVTRAKKLLIITGAPSTIQTMVENNRKMTRYSLLRHILSIKLNDKDTDVTKEE